MSFAVTAAVAVGVNVASLGYSIYSGERAADAQQAAQKKAKKAALKAEADQDAQIGRANAKKPDTLAILQAAQARAGEGISGTMLTGSQGLGGTMQTGSKNLLGS